MKLTITDYVVVAIVFGGVAGGAYALGTQARVVEAPVAPVQREYTTQQVWSPACGPDVAGKGVDEAAVRALQAGVGTAEWGDGVRTVLPGDAYAAPMGRARRTPYERARDGAERRYYRDMFRTPPKAR